MKKVGSLGRRKKIKKKGTLLGFCRVDRFPPAQLQAQISNETNSANPTGFWWEQGPPLLGPGGSWAPP
jgi:hypothetical protein